MSSPSIVVVDRPASDPCLIPILQRHVPRSLAVLRRMQFALTFPISPSAHLLLAHHGSALPSAGDHFAAAYVDLSMVPETQAWLFSTVEARLPSPAAGAAAEPADVEERARCAEQVVALLRRVKAVAEEQGGFPRGRSQHGWAAGEMKFGSLDSGLRDLLVARGLAFAKWPPYQKWLMRVDRLPAFGGGREPPGGEELVWDVLRREDVPLVQARTRIPKVESTLMRLPSVVVRRQDNGTAVAWGFLGLDGTLSTLHCEEAYRRRGIAKAVACKVIRENSGVFGGDGWCSSDVAADNMESQGVCRSLGGELGWITSWTLLDMNSVADANMNL